jgi:hypothetical protein
MNIDEEIKILEDQQEAIQEKLDELYDIKHEENKVFRDSLVGRCFKDGTRYIKILKRLDNGYNFETFEFDTRFNSKESIYDTLYNTFDYGDRFIQEADYFEDEEEITNEEFMEQFNRLVVNIRNNIIA